MNRLLQKSAAAFAACAIVLATWAPVVTVPPAEAGVTLAAPELA